MISTAKKERFKRGPYTQKHIWYMKKLQRSQKKLTKKSHAENWMASRLDLYTDVKWKRQKLWGFRVFDFFCQELGIAVEVDDRFHDPEWDKFRDWWNFTEGRIMVLRVRCGNEKDLYGAIKAIKSSETWKERLATKPCWSRPTLKAPWED